MSISTCALREEGDVLPDAGCVLAMLISIYALREEGDGCRLEEDPPHQDFYPRPPRGGRPDFVRRVREGIDYFYPRPPRGGRLFAPVDDKPLRQISIHALREEGDSNSTIRLSRFLTISIHALREEGDALSSVMGTPINEFLSTPSARRATDFNRATAQTAMISIHALREEGDVRTSSAKPNFLPFLSTPSARRATSVLLFGVQQVLISIHALREEGDGVSEEG